MADGVGTVGRGKRGPCDLRPYSHGCENGKTPHHVVPDHCFKQPGKGGACWPGSVPHADGLCICLDGATKSTGKNGGNIQKSSFFKGKTFDPSAHFNALAQHGQVHSLLDAEEAIAGGTSQIADLGKMEAIGASAAGTVTGCDPAHLEEQVRTHHQKNYGLDKDFKVRADPTGKKGPVDFAKMGKGQTNIKPITDSF